MKTKIKPIMPCLKEKKRYISYRVVSEKAINEKIARAAINSYMLKFLGELGYSKAGIIFLGHGVSSGIIKASNRYVDEVKAALALIDNIDKIPVNVCSTAVSGILNKTRQKMEVN